MSTASRNALDPTLKGTTAMYATRGAVREVAALEQVRDDDRLAESSAVVVPHLSL